jgi:hypothetical protein
VKTGVQCFCNALKFLDSGVHRNDDSWAFSTFDKTINFVIPAMLPLQKHSGMKKRFAISSIENSKMTLDLSR